MNRGLHGATPTLDGVVEIVDMVRTIRKRRELALEAMMDVNKGNWSPKTNTFLLDDEVVIF
jgi:hypothetical protein